MGARVLCWLLVGACGASVATCGQKGPLELPDEQAAVHDHLPIEVARAGRSTMADGLVPSRVRRLGLVCRIRGETDGIRA